MGMTKYLDHSVQDDWKVSKKRPFPHRIVKRNGAIYGHLRKLPDGTVAYFAERKVSDPVVIRDAWAIDKATLTVVKSFGVKIVGIVVENGDTYLSRFEWWKLERDGGKCLNWNFEGHVGRRGKLGANQLCMPRHAFIFKLAEPESTIKTMRIGGSR